MSAFVLVHGAWHGGWCWSRVVERLERRGHQAFAPTLSGLDADASALGEITLSTHVDDVTRLFEAHDLHDVVVCGHSYGGCVIAGVIERVPERIASAVFLDAFVPADAQCVLDIVPEAQRARQLEAIAASGGVSLAPIPAASFRVNEADRDLVDTRCRPQPAGTFSQALTLTAAQQRVGRRTYVRATGYPSATFDRFRAETEAAGWRVVDVPCGHDVMLDDPDALTEILLDARP